MKELNPLLHSQLRLAIMSILMNVEEADFVYLKEKTEATSGNISVTRQIGCCRIYRGQEVFCRQKASHYMSYNE